MLGDEPRGELRAVEGIVGRGANDDVGSAQIGRGHEVARQHVFLRAADGAVAELRSFALDRIVAGSARRGDENLRPARHIAANRFQALEAARQERLPGDRGQRLAGPPQRTHPCLQHDPYGVTHAAILGYVSGSGVCEGWR